MFAYFDIHLHDDPARMSLPSHLASSARLIVIGFVCKLELLQDN